MLKNRLIYLLVLCFSLVPVALRENHFSYFILYAVLLVPLLCLVPALLARRSITARHTAPASAFKGEVVEYSLCLSSRSTFPVGIYASALMPKNLQGLQSRPRYAGSLLQPGQSTSFCFEVTASRRGVYLLAPKGIYAGDPLGLFRFKIKESPAPMRLVVLPRPLPVAGFIPPACQAPFPANETRHGEEDHSQTSGVRSYIPQDASSRIDWKTSARTGALYSKDFARGDAPTACFVLDTCIAAPAAEENNYYEDHILEACLSIMCHCANYGQAILPASPNDAVHTALPPHERPQMYNWAARQVFQPLNFAAWFAAFCPPRGAGVYLFTGNLSTALAGHVLSLLTLRHPVFVFCFSSEEPSTLTQLKNAGAACFLLNKAQTFQSVFAAGEHGV